MSKSEGAKFADESVTSGVMAATLASQGVTALVGAIALAKGDPMRAFGFRAALQLLELASERLGDQIEGDEA